MTPPQGSNPRPKSASPAERSAELAEAQRRLKQEAADRRLKAEEAGADKRQTRPTGRSRSRG